MHWLHLEAPASVQLQLLDDFLRDLWLECCGHLSCFTIDGVRYEAVPGRKRMRETLGRRRYDGCGFTTNMTTAPLPNWSCG